MRRENELLITAPIGEGRCNRAARLAALEAQQAQTMVRIARDTGDVPLRKIAPGSLPGDELALRGIPAVGRGVSGAIRGTRPGDGIRPS